MVLPLFHIPGIESLPSAGDLVTLAGAEAKHAVNVRRMRVGEGIQLSDGLGHRIIGVVHETQPNQLVVKANSATLEPAPEPALILVQALAKGDRDELAIQAATELGVRGVIPWQAERSISRWDAQKQVKGVDRWQQIVAEAAKQALRSRTPMVQAPKSTADLTKMATSEFQLIVLDPTATESISSCSLHSIGEIAILVGPEGGISPSELADLESAGAIRVRLGEEILRTSTAGMAAISVLQSRLGRW